MGRGREGRGDERGHLVIADMEWLICDFADFASSMGESIYPVIYRLGLNNMFL